MGGNHGLYYNMLQAEETEVIGWLLYSTQAIDAGALAEELLEQEGINIGLRWMTINTGVKGVIPKDHKVNALHVEAEKGKKYDVRKKLLKLYGRTTANSELLPNGIRLRFVTPRAEAASTHAKSKLDRLRQRQKGFLSSIRSLSTWDIMHLDWNITPEKPTLRQLIMNIKPQTCDTKLIFSVDLDWRGDGHIFQFLPELQDEAESMIHTLLPYLKWSETKRAGHTDFNEDSDSEEEDIEHTNSMEELEMFFSAESIERTEDMKYNEEKGIVEDQLVDNNLEFVDDDNLLENSNFEDLINCVNSNNTPVTNNGQQQRPHPTALKSKDFRADDDSLSTLGNSVLTPSQSLAKRRHSGRRRLIGNSDESTSSTSTGITFASFNALESQVQSISEGLIQNKLGFEKIIQMLEQDRKKTNTNHISQSLGDYTDAGGSNTSTGEGL